MTDIPEDVMKLAQECIPAKMLWFRTETEANIARAILAGGTGSAAAIPSKNNASASHSCLLFAGNLCALARKIVERAR